MLSQVFESHLCEASIRLYTCPGWVAAFPSLQGADGQKYVMSYHWQPVRLPPLPSLLPQTPLQVVV